MKKLTVIYFFLIAFVIPSLITNCTDGIIPETGATPPDNPTDEVTYQTHIQMTISTFCLSCHNTSNPQGNLLLEDYNQVRNATENGNLIQRINDAADPMPATGLMSIQTRLLFDEWVQNGFLEN